MIACRTAQFFRDGNIVNLGIGMPTQCLDFLPDGVDVWVDTENGAIGLAGAPGEGDEFPVDIVDAGGNPSKLRVGGCCFDSFTSFGYIRGGHVDITVLGAYEVDAEGSLANWMIPGKAAAGMGGAMDLVSGSKITIVMTMHCDKKGNPKIVQKTEMPLTGWRVVDYVVTELAVIHITPEGPVLEEISENTTVEEVVAKTGAKLIIPDNVKVMSF
jgi:3-oxoacid CoA-transferase B subunit